MVTRILFAILAALSAAPAQAVLTSSNVPAHTHANVQQGGVLGSVNVTGTLSSTKACATDYTRVAPNYCRFTGSSSLQFTWTNVIGCTERLTGANLPADAKLVVLSLNVRTYSLNVVGFRNGGVKFHFAANCGAGGILMFFNLYEFVAVAAGTNISETMYEVTVPLLATNKFYTTEITAGGNGTTFIFAYQVVGYIE